MKIIYLTHAEAADPAVIENVRAILAGDVEITPPDVSGVRLVMPADNPAAGLVVPTVADAAQAFGHQETPAQAQAAAQAFAPQLPAGAPSTVGAGQSLTAPAVPLAPAGATHAIVQSQPAVSPAPAASAPMAPVAPMSPVSGVEVDAEGLPWDERIHAGSKTQTKGGNWVAKRGVNDGAFIAAVKAELRQLMAAPAPQSPVAPLPPPITQPAAPAMSMPPSQSPAFVAPAPTIAPAVPPTGETFAQFMQRLSPYTVTGQITTERIAQVGQQLGFTLTQLQQRPDLIPAFAQALGL